ncbi:MAG: hypothetical protein A2428_09770 [Bdellovibrionales bacterium RIFOXYC1_FULL_54_43]|nr:MAG: hypothetical protein A2428_09770 [Bdellovibrionales bacterium RIFOXYC1_FULL_54_43]
MPEGSSSSFLFTVCQIGAENALKKEITREHPELRFAYSRPGFLTFKFDPKTAVAASPNELTPEFELRSAFARAYGISLEEVASPALIIEKTLELKRALYLPPEEAFRLHVWEKDEFPKGEEPPDFATGQASRGLERLIRKEAGSRGSVRFHESVVAMPGDFVLNVIILGSRKLEKPVWWLGYHRHTPQHSPFPGGIPEIELPPEAPSRAFLKLEEAVLRSGAPLLPGDTAVEIGSAPGGASYALLQKGLNVVGIDPGEMDARVMAAAHFKHIQKVVAAVHRPDLPASVEWLLVDMNVTPNIALFAIDRLASRTKDTLLGVLLTIKLNQWKMADQIPSMLEHVKVMGMVRARAVQLFHNRQEILIYGFTRKGLLRKTSRVG